MKILLVHPDDSPVEGPWSRSHWDYVIDLGWAGGAAYHDWERQMGCPVRGFYGFAGGPEDFRRIADILRPGRGILVDDCGLDWWEILAPLRSLELLNVVIVKRILPEIASAEIFCTRSHPIANLLAKAAGRDIRMIQLRNQSALREKLQRIRLVAALLSPAQIFQIVLDKWDMDYRLRSRVVRLPSPASRSSVLLPSSYSNVTRMLNAYAKLLPQTEFSLVTTRQNGVTAGLAANVRTTSLANFAPAVISDSIRREVRSLEHGWSRLLDGPLRANQEIAWATDSGWFADIGRSFERWLRVREAWRHVLSVERISAVLCADENNPMNRLPVLLARNLKLPTVHCDHGALNALLPLRTPACDHYLVKGEMEREFMSRTFLVKADRITVGAPEEPFADGSEPGSTQKGTSNCAGAIVFFSEQYELTLGRTEILYKQVLPGLCAIARSRGSRVIVKLHPFESLTSRRRLLRQVLSKEDWRQVSLVTGALTGEFLAGIWFAVTVESSVAVDCASRGLPCFLCSWFVPPLAGYEKQFVRHGAARSLESPEQIGKIPELLEDFRITPEIQRGLWSPITPARLEALLSNSRGLD